MINPEFLAKVATDALLQEVNLAPKPGLVDPISVGAHKDMTKETFYQSIEALRPYLLAYAKAGSRHNGSPLDLFNELRALGKQAENAMMTATNNINTHKGANFSFALVLGATAHTNGNIPEALHYCHLMTRHLIEVDFANLDQKEHLSYGENSTSNMASQAFEAKQQQDTQALQKPSTITIHYTRTHHVTATYSFFST